MLFVCAVCLDCSLSVFSYYVSIHWDHNGALHFGWDFTMTIEQATNKIICSAFYKKCVTILTEILGFFLLRT